MSISTFNFCPAAAAPKVVAAWVCGITLISKRSSATPLTVSDTPSRVIEPLGGNIRREPGLEGKFEHAGIAGRFDAEDLSDTVDMAADQMSAQFVANRQGAFEVDRGPVLPTAQGGFRPRLAGRIDGEPVGTGLDHGQAHPRTGDRRADGDRRRRIASLDPIAHIATPFDGDYAPDIGNDSGKHDG